MNFPESVAWFSLQVALLIALVAVLQVGLRRWLTPRWRCWLWGLVVLRLALPASFRTDWSLFNLLPQPTPTRSTPTTRRSEAPPVLPAHRTAAALPLEEPDLRRPPVAVPGSPGPEAAAAAVPGSRPETATPLPSPRSDQGSRRVNSAHLLALLWALGAVALLVHTARGARRLSRWVATSQPCTDPMLLELLGETAARLNVRRLPEARELAGLGSPSLYGFLRPLVLFPPGLVQRLSARQLRHVLLHELAHVKRRDIALNWLLALLQAVYWFHPLVWWALARLRAERELACDEIALQAAGPDAAEDYGETILQMLAAWSRPAASPAVVGILEDRRHLRHRLLHIADFRPGHRTGITLLLGLGLVGAVTLTDAQTPGARKGSSALPVGTNLPPVVPLRYTNLLQQAEARDLHSSGDWAKAHRGSNVFGGVHFEIDGLVQLASKSSEQNQRDFRPHLTLPIPTNTYGAVHLLAATAWTMENNRTVADVIWRYTDGTFQRTPLLYAGHVRTWRRRLFEDPHRVYSKLAKAAVTWSSPEADRAGTRHRMYRVTLANPEPTRKVAALQFQSAMNEASLMFLAVSLDPLAAGARPDPEPDLEPEDPQWTRHLGVTVIGAASSNRVGGATVKARVVTTAAAGRQFIERTYTADGSGIADVLLPEQDVDSVSLTVSHPNYSETQYNVPNANNALQPGLTIRLRAGMEMGGVILDQAGQPIPGATVRVSRIPNQPNRLDAPGEVGFYSSPAVTTGPDGRWQLSHVPVHLPNRVSVSASHDDYVPARIESSNPNDDIERALGEKRHELKLQNGLWVAGVVVNPEGMPVTNAEVRVGRRHFAGTRQIKTGSDGRFRIGGQASGENVISASAQGYAGTAIKAKISADMGELRLVLARGSVLRGRVVDPEGQPVADAMVTAGLTGMPANELDRELVYFNTRTDAEGRWQWDSSPDAGIPFAIHKPGFTRVSDILLRPGDAEHLITLSRPRSVVGRVTDEETGEPVSDFSLEPRSPAGSGGAQSFRSPDGRYQTLLETEHHDQFLVRSPTHENRVIPIPATSHAVVQLDIRLKRAEILEGTVVDSTGRAVPLADVTLNSPMQGGVRLRRGRLESAGLVSIATSAPDGTFRLPPQPDPTAVVAASPEGFGYTPIEQFRLTRRVVLQPYGRVEGTYRGRVDANGRARLSLHFFHEQRRVLGVLGTDEFWPEVESGGTFTIERVPAGSHRLERMVRMTFSSGASVPLATLEVRPGETARVEAVATEGVRITGRYALPNGVKAFGFQLSGNISQSGPEQPRSGLSAEEQKKAEKAPTLQATPGEHRSYPLQFQSEGTFIADDLPPGEYGVGVSAYQLANNQLRPGSLFTATRQLKVPTNAAPGSTIDLGVLSLEPTALPTGIPR